MEFTEKHIKKTSNESLDTQSEALLPGLPNHLGQICLSTLPPSLLFSVCRSWRRLLYSPSFPPFFSLYALLSPPRNYVHVDGFNSDSIQFFSLDPISSSWQPLPSPPREPLIGILHYHPSFLSRNLPIQSVTVSNHLVLVAATAHIHRFVPALSSPLVFNPESNHWFFGPPFSVPRRWCAAGTACGSVYIASGIGSHYQGDVARSMDKWDVREKSESWSWESKAPLKHGRFSREAVEAVGYRGKLCMVNVKGNAVKEGAVYDVELNQWEDMPQGMMSGWTGPVATMNEKVMYVVDEFKGALGIYDDDRDCWEKVIEREELKCADQIAAGRGRVCVICGGGERITVVDVTTEPARVWIVGPPCGLNVVQVHILPRMSKQHM